MAIPAAVPNGSPGEVLRLIRDGRATTRNEVMGLTGLSRSTVTHRLGLLLSAGIFGVAGEPEAMVLFAGAGLAALFMTAVTRYSARAT